MRLHGSSRWSRGPQRAGHSRRRRASNSLPRRESIGEIFEQVATWTMSIKLSHPVLRCSARGIGTRVGIDTGGATWPRVAQRYRMLMFVSTHIRFGAQVFQSILSGSGPLGFFLPARICIGNYFCWFVGFCSLASLSSVIRSSQYVTRQS